MPAKKTNLTDAERAKRIRETAREIGTDNDPQSLERAFEKVVRPPPATYNPYSLCYICIYVLCSLFSGYIRIIHIILLSGFAAESAFSPSIPGRWACQV